jgi:hypothetical protein
MRVDPPDGACGECGGPLAADQRYCLTCGARTGTRSAALEGLMRNAADGWRGPERAPAAVPSPAAEAQAVQRRPAAAALPRLLSPKYSAALVAGFLGFGVLLGLGAGSATDSTLAANARAPLRLIVPGGGATTTPQTSTSPESSPSSEPPETGSEPEATPAPAPTSAPPATAPSTSTEPAGEPSSGSEGGSSGSAPKAATKLPAFKHVFVIMLSNEPYAAAFGPASSARYLTGTLEKQGELLVRYDAVAHAQLADGMALVSGQGPTEQTAANCPAYSDVAPAGAGASGQVLGGGCVYPATTPTLPGQLTAKHLTWRAYVEGIDEGAGAPPACAHPGLGAADPSAGEGASGAYATFRNPFVYFHSIVDSPSCAKDDVGLPALGGDLASAARTPSFSYIAPDRCHDGDPTPCAPGAPAGMGPADAFLKRVVPEITASKAYKQGGLLVITVDQAPTSGEFADSSSCCGQPRFPNLPPPAGGLSPRGGGAVGALLLSRWVKGGTTSQEPFNHFSLLRTVEDLFSLGHIGYAGLSGVKPLEAGMFTATPAG